MDRPNDELIGARLVTLAGPNTVLERPPRCATPAARRTGEHHVTTKSAHAVEVRRRIGP